MLNLKDRLYVRKQIKLKSLYITKQERKKLTHEDIEKIQYVLKESGFIEIRFNYLSRVSLSQLYWFIGRYNLAWSNIIKLIDKGYNLEKFIDKIVKNYPDSSIYVLHMLSPEYTIAQMQFLLENNMLYYSYHKTFDYEDIFKRCKEIDLDVSSEYCNIFPIEFLELLREKYTPEECYKLLKEANDRILRDKFIEICKFLVNKDFEIPEIMLVIKKMIKIERLKTFFSYGGTKEELMRYIILDI